MRLQGKKLLILISDGVDQLEFLQLKNGFEEEGASLLVTSPQDHLIVESVENSRRGSDILVDLPFDAVADCMFDGLVIPDGVLSTESLRKDGRVVGLVEDFHDKRLPIFASGFAIQLLYDSGVLFSQVVIRDGTPLSHFLDSAVSVLLDKPSLGHAYRSTMAV